MSETIQEIRDRLTLKVERNEILISALNTTTSAATLMSEAVKSDSLNPGAIRNAIDCLERAANTLKPLIQ